MNNPIDEVVKSCNKLYPNYCELIFAEGIKDKEDAWAVTVWPDDGTNPAIWIDVSSPYMAVVELIAHEYAHVVAGHSAGHGPDWEKVFDAVNVDFNSADDGE